MEERIGEVLRGRYVLEQLLGAGGAGEVFRAFDNALRRRVAVKMLRPSSLGDATGVLRFKREARAAARVQSPHVVAIYDVGTTDDGSAYLVQELLTGRTLEAERATEPGRAVLWAMQASRALAAIHGAGMVHRDVKPSNLFLAQSQGIERVVLLDFGIARSIVEDASAQLTANGSIVGTPLYMSPEQIATPSAVDARSDLYSLGVTLLELLTGSRPFSGGMAAVIGAILLEGPTTLGRLPALVSPQLEAVVVRCLARAPDDRYPSAEALFEALGATPEAYVPTPRVAEPGRDVALSNSRTFEVTTGVLETGADDDEPPPSTPFRGQPPPPPPPPRRKAHPSPRSPHPDLECYLAQAGLGIVDGPGPLLALSRAPDCRLPPLRISALVLEAADAPLPTTTMGTQVFQLRAGPLYALQGTVEEPHHVLVVLRSQPGAGVYREWHDLGVRGHVHVSPVAPSALRDAVDAGRAAEHLVELLRRARHDPFELDGRIVTDLDFFGKPEDLQPFLRQVEQRGEGLGVFGLSKWGTTSLLLRFRAELGHRPSAWVDLAALPAISLPSLLAVVHDDLAVALRSLRKPVPARPHDLEASLPALLEACQSDGRGPVIFLDRVDELSIPERCAPEAQIGIARAFYRLAFPGTGRAGAVLVFGGREAHFLTAPTFGPYRNPLAGAIAVRYAPFFSREELGDFLVRLGALGGLSFNRAALDQAFTLTGGHKYLSRHLGSLLYQRRATGGAEVTSARIAACVQALVTRHHAYFGDLVRSGPPALDDVLGRLARGPATLEDLLGSDGSPEPDAGFAALHFAQAYGLVVEEQESYRLTVGLLEAWLRWRHAQAPRPRSRPAPPVAPPSLAEVAWLVGVLDQALSNPANLELLVMEMGGVPADVVDQGKPLRNQSRQLVDWARRNHRFAELCAVMRKEFPAYFQGGGVGQTQVVPSAGWDPGRGEGHG